VPSVSLPSFQLFVFAQLFAWFSRCRRVDDVDRNTASRAGEAFDGAINDICTKRCAQTKFGRKAGPKGSRRHDAPATFLPLFRSSVSSKAAITGIVSGRCRQTALRTGAKSLSGRSAPAQTSGRLCSSRRIGRHERKIIPARVWRPRQAMEPSMKRWACSETLSWVKAGRALPPKLIEFCD